MQLVPRLYIDEVDTASSKATGTLDVSLLKLMQPAAKQLVLQTIHC
jgi:hypothetical protein